MILLECKSVSVIFLTNAAQGLPMALRMKFKLNGLVSLTFWGSGLSLPQPILTEASFPPLS